MLPIQNQTTNFLVPSSGFTSAFSFKHIDLPVGESQSADLLSLSQDSGKEFEPQGVYFDNSSFDGQLVFQFEPSGLIVKCPPNSQGGFHYPAGPGQTVSYYLEQTGTQDIGTFSFVLVDYPVIPWFMPSKTGAVEIVQPEVQPALRVANDPPQFDVTNQGCFNLQSVVGSLTSSFVLPLGAKFSSGFLVFCPSGSSSVQEFVDIQLGFDSTLIFSARVISAAFMTSLVVPINLPFSFVGDGVAEVSIIAAGLTHADASLNFSGSYF